MGKLGTGSENGKKLEERVEEDKGRKKG